MLATVVCGAQYKSGQLDADPENWGRTGKNVLVLDSVRVDEFWRNVFLATVDRADLVVPINKRSRAADDDNIMRYEV